MIAREERRYRKQAETGIPSLGKIPSHWRVRRVKDEFHNLDYRRIPLSAEVRGYMQKPQYDYYGASGVIDKVDEYIFDEDTILIGEDGANLLMRGSALAFIAQGKYWVNNHAHILKPKKGILVYLCHLLEAFDYTEFISGAAQPKFTSGALGRVFLMIPPLSEQIIIASYIVRETAAIDGKVALLEEKARLYKALKQSLINETVTRGLDPSAPLRDSGIDWIGEIPKHWEVKRGKDIYTEIKTVTSTGEEDLLSVSEYTGVTPKPRDAETGENASRAASLVGYRKCSEGDLVSNIMLAWKRALGVAPCDGIASPAYGVYRHEKKMYPKFMHYLMRNDQTIWEFKRNSSGIIESRLRLYTDNFFALKFAVPDLDEQQAIAKYLDENINRIDQIVEAIAEQVRLLKELRKTLINDVVTGKIRVTEMEGGVA